MTTRETPETQATQATQNTPPATTPGLHLDSLEIQNFRLFRHLTIERLGRVNLVVGRNSVGKTALLEALYLYAEGGNDTAQKAILIRRDEQRREDMLFRPDNSKERADIFVIGPKDALKTELVYVPGRYAYRLPYTFVPARGLDVESILRYWDRIEASSAEDTVIHIMHIINDKITTLRMVHRSEGLHEPSAKRIPVARLRNEDKPVPLKSLGEGMNRLLGIALALVNAKDGFLLIDEIESGLHYTVQYKMWELIFAAARRLNVQVFATTHSWDCIEAFQQAASATEEHDGMLIRLGRKGEDVVATVFDEDGLEVFTRHQIEVR